MVAPLICSTSTVLGSVEIGDGTIIHPMATINALNGPIVIGCGNLIEEFAEIINHLPSTLTIGNRNTLRVGCSKFLVGWGGDDGW